MIRCATARAAAPGSAALDLVRVDPGEGGCEKLQACKSEDASQCATACINGAAQADAIGCRAEWDADYDCYVRLDDPCDDHGECSPAGGAFFSCFLAFCAGQPNDPNCD